MADILQKAGLIVFIRGVIGSVKITDPPGTIVGDHAVYCIYRILILFSQLCFRTGKKSRGAVFETAHD